MLWMKRVVVGDGERGLKYKNRRFEKVLMPGVYWLNAFGSSEVRLFDLAKDEYDGKDVDVLIESLAERDFRARRYRYERGWPRRA